MPRRGGDIARLVAIAGLAAIMGFAAAPTLQAAPPFKDEAKFPAQFPRLLLRYPVRPPFAVAGVDYGVGVPPGTPLQDPATLAGPGVSVDASRHLVFLTGDGIAISAVDFARDGGWAVRVRGHGDAIRRCRFRVGANNLVPIQGGRDAAALSVEDSTIDGGGASPGAESIYAVLDFAGPDLTVLRSEFLYTPVDAVDFNGGGRLVVRSNLFHDLGYTQGAHADAVQFTRGDVREAVIEGNTVYDPQPHHGFPVTGGEGLQVEAQLGGAIRHVALIHNVVIASGPAKTAGYLIAIRQDAGSLLDGLVAEGNYLDATGGWGPFYPPSGSHLSFAANVDLLTGRGILPPR